MAEKKIDAGAIQIEDPLDFLTPAEKKEYIRAHQDTLLRSEEELKRIREATEAATAPDGFEVEDLYEEEDDEERPARKPYVYQDTRLHTDERRNRAAREERGRKQPARPRVAYAGEADAAFAEDEVEDTAFDYMLSVAMKAFLAAIIIVALIIAYMIYVRPMIRRATGLAGQAVESRKSKDTENTDGDETNVQAQSKNEQQGTPRPAAPADGETVITTTQLNLRTAPNTDTSEVVRTVPAGTRLTRLSDDGEWSKISIDGQELYCASQYLEAE